MRTLASLFLFSAAPLCAQAALIHDNGPFQTGVGTQGPISVLQSAAPNSLTVFGFTANIATVFSMADDFIVCSTMVVQEIEVFGYQTGSSTTSTMTGAFVEIYGGDPRTGGLPVTGSPGMTTNLLLNAGSTTTFSGVYKVQDIALTATNRPIMSCRGVLTTPIVLGPGRYWLRYALSGSLASGPFVSPIVVLNQQVTGDSIQTNTATPTWANAVSGASHGQGLPFRLYGVSGNPVASIVNTGLPSCGGAQLTVQGAPALGGFLRSELTGVTGLGLIGFGFSTTPTPFCGCAVGHDWSVIQVSNTSSVMIPPNSAFCGVVLRVQGGDLGSTSPGSCPNPMVAFTDTYQVTVW